MNDEMNATNVSISCHLSFLFVFSIFFCTVSEWMSNATRMKRLDQNTQINKLLSFRSLVLTV